MTFRPVHHLFEALAKEHPNREAVLFRFGRLTYHELDDMANSLAWKLRVAGCGPGKIVGLMTDRSHELIPAIFGILKSGAAYMPLSPANPPQRNAFMLNTSGATVFLCQDRFSEKISFEGKMMNLSDASLFKGNYPHCGSVADPDALAYVIYTSGSTGVPKGVMIPHGPLLNRLNWMQKQYPIGEGDTLIQKTPLIFDVSVWELFWWAITGARLCVMLPGLEKFPQAIIGTIQKYQVTHAHFVPSMLTAFLNYVAQAGEASHLKSLKRVFSSGEALTPAHVEQFNSVMHKENGTQLSNLYGPTEATVDVTWYDIPPGEVPEKIPIGREIDNCEVMILKDGLPVPDGEQGELCLSGNVLARGYLGDPQKTAAAFGVHPNGNGQRIYYSGDLGRKLPDGQFEFLGRIDQQIKIRGLRIELGEIESRLRQHHTISDCVVIGKKRTETLVLIVAYIVTTKHVPHAVLKEYLADFLPPYMVPGFFVEVEKIPLLHSGKADRKALPEPDLDKR